MNIRGPQCAALTIQAWHRQSDDYFPEQANCDTALLRHILWLTNEPVMIRFLTCNNSAFTCIQTSEAICKTLEQKLELEFSHRTNETCSNDCTHCLAGTVCQFKTYPCHKLPIANRWWNQPDAHEVAVDLPCWTWRLQTACVTELSNCSFKKHVISRWQCRQRCLQHLKPQRIHSNTYWLQRLFTWMRCDWIQLNLYCL